MQFNGYCPVYNPPHDAGASSSTSSDAPAAAAPAPAGAAADDDAEKKKSEEYSEDMSKKMGASLTYQHELGMNYNRILPDLIVGSCLQVRTAPHHPA